MLTFVIPTAPYHEAAVEQAAASVQRQTLRCALVIVYDYDQRGAGWARNRGLEQVSTPFVSFLDADDWIDPTFAEKCLRAYTGRHYVYTDWHAEGVIEAPCKPWNGSGAAHIITTLLPTNYVRHVGGFDEQLPGMEDTDLYWKLTRSGFCGKRLPEALFHYGKGGKRAQAFRDRPDRDAITKTFLDRYKGLTMPQDCGGCGGAYNPDIPNLPANQPFEGSALATALWAGNRQVRGRITGTLYPRSGNGKQLFVHEHDIDAAPHEFARVVDLPPPVSESDIEAWRTFTGRTALAFGSKAPIIQTPAPASAERGEAAPDVNGVLRLYAQNT